MAESKKIADAYIDIEDRILDPELLDKSILDRMPQPTGWRMLVLQCYNDKARYGDKPWCEEKQWVLIGRYSGSRFKLEDGAEVRIINDDEVIATILNPDDIVSL